MIKDRTTPLVVLPGDGMIIVGLPDGSALALTEAAAIATSNRLQSAAYAVLAESALKIHGRGCEDRLHLRIDGEGD